MKQEIDLKTLKIIHTIVTLGTVTKAAQKLKQSPGNISYQLGKARTQTGSHLFIRTRDGMKPDATALELSQRYENFTESKRSQDGISLSASRDNLKVNTWSLIEMMFAANMFGKEQLHPPCRFIFKGYEAEPEERLMHLKNRDVDIDIGNKLPPDNGINAIKLFTTGVSVLVGNQNRPGDTPFSLQELRDARYAVWSTAPDYYSDSIDEANLVSELIQSRNVAVISGSMVNMVSLCANSDYIMLIPTIFTTMLERNFQVKCLPLPDELSLYHDCYLHYHPKLSAEPQAMESVHTAVNSIKNGLMEKRKLRWW